MSQGKPETTPITQEMWDHFGRLSEEHHLQQQAEIERLRNEVASADAASDFAGRFPDNGMDVG